MVHPLLINVFRAEQCCQICSANRDRPLDLVAWYTKNDYAYNLYQCRYCGAICKQDVKKSKGELWVTVKNAVRQQPPRSDT
jgi:hypothetical protein